jgi:protein gp37
MGDRSKIEWTDATWNPIRGCSRVSEGCRNCYAERTAARFAGAGQPYEGMAFPTGGRGVDAGGKSHGWTGDVRFIPELLEQPLRWKRPRKIFVNSMSDLFHEKVHGDWIDAIFKVMAQCERHTFQILTKRPERMLAFMRHYGSRRNVWLGVSVEDQSTADKRIPLLLETPAAVRWVSYEPALGPVDFTDIDGKDYLKRGIGLMREPHGLDWVVAGGESGPGARCAHPKWIRTARDQCRAAGVSFFFKQWGEWLNASQLRPAFSDSELDRTVFRTVRREPEDNKPNAGLADLYFRVGKKRAGRLLDGREWSEFPR